MRRPTSTAAVLSLTLFAGAAFAQETPPPAPAEAPAEAMAEVPTAAEWWIMSRAPTRRYLIDVRSIAREGDDLTVWVARVATDRPAGDYSHTVDQFGIRCEGRQSHVVASRAAGQDGVLDEPFAADEPWEPITEDSFDDGVRRIACDNARPEGPAYDSIKAYIDAGRR